MKYETFSRAKKIQKELLSIEEFIDNLGAILEYENIFIKIECNEINIAAILHPDNQVEKVIAREICEKIQNNLEGRREQLEEEFSKL